MSEGAEFSQREAIHIPTLLPICPARGCKRGKVQTQPGVWSECRRCHGSGYDTEPPKVRSSSTSAAAGESVKEVAATIRARLLSLLRKRVDGLTDEQMQSLLNLSGNSQRPRRVELQKLGLIEARGTRPTSSGRVAQVWGLTNCQRVSNLEEPSLEPPNAAA